MDNPNRKSDTFLNTRVTTEVKEKLRYYSEAHEMSMTEIINIFIDILPDPEKSTPEEQRKSFYRLIDLRDPK